MAKAQSSNTMYWVGGGALFLLALSIFVYYQFFKSDGTSAGSSSGGSGGSGGLNMPSDAEIEAVILSDYSLNDDGTEIEAIGSKSWREVTDKYFQAKFNHPAQKASEVVRRKMEVIAKTPTWMQSINEASAMRGTDFTTGFVLAAMLASTKLYDNTIIEPAGAEYWPPIFSAEGGLIYDNPLGTVDVEVTLPPQQIPVEPELV